MRSCILLLCLLEEFVLLHTCIGYAVSPKVEVKEITVQIDNSSLEYPDSVVLFPDDFPDDQRRLLFHQMDHGVPDNRLTSEDNNDDVSVAVRAVLRAAELVLKADNNTQSDVEGLTYAKRETSPMHVYVVDSMGPGSEGRQRRSVRRMRSAYTTQWQDLCDSCPALAPQQPVVINIIKTGSGCGNDCTTPQSKPASCGFPQCESHFPHHPSMFHQPPHPPPHFHHYPPPPPPPPHFHHYPPPPPPPQFHHYPPPQVFYSPSPPAQPVTTRKPVVQQPQQPARQQPRPLVNSCDPCAPPAAPQPAPRPAPQPNPQPAPQPAYTSGGSFSQSSASAQSSSFSWNG